MSDHSPEDRITHIDGVSRFCDTCDHEVWPCPTRILTDLIAELVGDDGDGHELTGDDKHGCQVCAAIDRAEARLKEVTDTSGASPRSGPEE